MAIASSATLSGQVATPRRVSGVTAPPSEIPIRMKSTRAAGAGTSMGRPSNAAAPTAIIAPDSQPAGMPLNPRSAPPATAMITVSAKCRD